MTILTVAPTMTILTVAPTMTIHCGSYHDYTHCGSAYYGGLLAGPMTRLTMALLTDHRTPARRPVRIDAAADAPPLPT